MPPNRAAALYTAPLDELIGVLLRQYRRPLTGQGVSLTDADADALAQTALADEQHPLKEAVRAALVVLVEESAAVLAQWGLAFAESVDTQMDALPGWTTTAEFLALAETKSNAELRIALGALLLLALGDQRHVDIVRWLAERADQPDYADIDTIVAKRLLALR